MTFIDKIKTKAQENIKKIVLPEAMDIRILKATEIIISEKIAEIVLLGNIDEIKQKAEEEKININGAILIDPEKSPKTKIYAKKMCELDNSITEEEAEKLVKNPVYYGMLMVKNNDADGYVSGAMNTTKNILKTAMKMFDKKDTKILSTSLIMVIPNKKYGSKDGVYVFADCALHESPGYIALSEIAIQSAKTYERITGNNAKVAMLSYSTYGSASSKSTEKVIKATKRVMEKRPDIAIEGEVQLDAAIVPQISESKIKNSKLKRRGKCFGISRY